MKVTDIRQMLLPWYREHGRATLPWRVRRDPYYTVVSEFMLQQTQVDRVLPAFEAFVARFESFAELAAASAADVIRQWKGLGYNSRAVRLQELARAVVARGDVPCDIAALRALPGVGAYTAAAIAAFAFDVDAAACDTNVRRVVHRLAFGIEFPAKASNVELEALADKLVPSGEAHDWNSAMMDLGATVCTARAPKCLLCPLRTVCVAAPVDAVALEAARKVGAGRRKPAVKFEKTARYARGRIVDRLRELPAHRTISLLDLYTDLENVLGDRTVSDVVTLVEALARDGVVEVEAQSIRLRS